MAIAHYLLSCVFQVLSTGPLSCEQSCLNYFKDNNNISGFFPQKSLIIFDIRNTAIFGKMFVVKFSPFYQILSNLLTIRNVGQIKQASSMTI